MLTVNLKIKGKEISLTPDELIELRNDINKLVGEQKYCYPYNPVIPNEPYTPNWPWPQVTYTGDTIPAPEYSTC